MIPECTGDEQTQLSGCIGAAFRRIVMDRVRSKTLAASGVSRNRKNVDGPPRIRQKFRGRMNTQCCYHYMYEQEEPLFVELCDQGGGDRRVFHRR